jgi:hypothetical protein
VKHAKWHFKGVIFWRRFKKNNFRFS